MWPPRNLCSMGPTHHSNTTIPKSHLSSELSANINNLQQIANISKLQDFFFFFGSFFSQWIVQVVAKMTVSLVFCLCCKESKRRECIGLIIFCLVGQQHSVSFTGCWGMWESPLPLTQHGTRLTLWLFPSAHSSLQPANYRLLSHCKTHILPSPEFVMLFLCSWKH